MPELLESNAPGHWQEKDTELYIVMEWIDGPTLTEAGTLGILA